VKGVFVDAEFERALYSNRCRSFALRSVCSTVAWPSSERSATREPQMPSWDRSLDSAEHVADFVGEAGTGQVELKVTRIASGVAGVEFEVGFEKDSEWILLRVTGFLFLRGHSCSGFIGGTAVEFFQLSTDGGKPFSRGFLAVDTWRDGRRAESRSRFQRSSRTC